MTQAGQPDADVLRRHFVAIATAAYDDERYAELPVKDAVAQLQEWLGDCNRLGERCFRPAFTELADDPGEDQIRAVFRKPGRRWTRADAAVVFVTGHGEVADQSHWLVLRESERDDLPGTAVRTADLISWLKGRHDIEHLLLIVDACFAGAIVNSTVSFDEYPPASWLIVPSAARDGEATAGALTAAVGNAVEKLRSGQGQKYGTHQRFFRVSDFIDAVREFLPTQEVTPLYRGNFNAEHVCLPNPHYTRPDAVATQPSRHDLALPQSDLDTHWAPRASGTTDGHWLFTGRADLMRELIATTRPKPGSGPTGDEPRVTLVTGRAGCGKSAVLARLVTLSDPTFVDTYADQVADIPADLRPKVGAVDVAVLATGKYPHEVLGQISDAIGAHRPEGARGDADLHLRIDACRAALDTLWRAGIRITVVLDALDEAEDPLGIARMLTHLAAGPGLHLLVGVRSPGGPDESSTTPLPSAAATPTGSLADQVERMLTARRLRVDDDQWWRYNDIRDYAASMLRHTPGSPYQDATHLDLATALATVIADHVGRSFLVARLAATALSQTPTLADPDDPHWRASLHDGVVGALRADLHRLHPAPKTRLATVELLRAVAFAYGRGLPWGDIWPLVANAVADRYGKYGDRDIADLLASPFSAYLITDQEDDITVYRLFHDALRDTLRTRWRELLHNPRPQ